MNASNLNKIPIAIIKIIMYIFYCHNIIEAQLQFDVKINVFIKYIAWLCIIVVNTLPPIIIFPQCRLALFCCV